EPAGLGERVEQMTERAPAAVREVVAFRIVDPRHDDVARLARDRAGDALRVEPGRIHDAARGELDRLAVGSDTEAGRGVVELAGDELRAQRELTARLLEIAEQGAHQRAAVHDARRRREEARGARDLGL